MTRSLADRTATQRRGDNGSVGRTADLRVPTTAGCVDGVNAPAPAQSDAVTGLTRLLTELTQELSDSRQRGDQLDAVLDKHTRRVQQLIGERDELRSLLARRDAELQQLNRELGGLTARARPAERSSPSLVAGVRKLLGRLRNVRKTPRDARAAAARAREPDARGGETRLVPWLKDRPPKEILAVVVFGLSAAEIERVLEAIERYCAEHRAAPLLLTDNDDFQLFRSRRVLFEFLPPRAEQQRLAPDLDWQLFTLRRLALIRRKWRPTQVVAFGRTAAEVVQRWLESPFEQTPVPALLKARSQGAELEFGAARAAEVM